MKSPFYTKLGFRKLIEKIEDEPHNFPGVDLSTFEHLDRLKDGFDIDEDIEPFLSEIEALLRPLFPLALTENEIKAAVKPMTTTSLMTSARFRKVVDSGFDTNPAKTYNLSEDEFYILQCSYMLSYMTQVSTNLSSTIYYKCKDDSGINKSYRVLNNFDFVDVKPSTLMPEMTTEDMTLLLDSPRDINLWKKYFPENSWDVNGFAILNLYDDTKSQSLAEFKNHLLDSSLEEFSKSDKGREDISPFETVLRSYFNIPDLILAFKTFDNIEFKYDSKTSLSFGKATQELLPVFNKDLFCSVSSKAIFKDHDIHIISNLDFSNTDDEHPTYFVALYNDGIRSYLAAPLIQNGKLIGIFELGSKTPFALNSLVKIGLSEFLPILTARITAIMNNKETAVRAVVQKEFTSIHPSVSWKFLEQGRAYIQGETNSGFIEDIVFDDLHALYGQSDIVGSSNLRNQGIIKDLSKQLQLISDILADAKVVIREMPLLDKVEIDCQELLVNLRDKLDAGSEQIVLQYIHNQVHPLFDILKDDPVLRGTIEKYYDRIDQDLLFIYEERKSYDDTIDRVNKELSRYLDIRQEKAQEVYPHYFERYKTDGVDHNIFIGPEITPDRPFNMVYLQNLRLWQLITVAEMHVVLENARHELALDVDIASLIMVYSNTLSIRYRIDEKRFDVDGAYNARYEIIKKRIDKSYIKNTNERLTQAGKIAVVFVHPEEEQNYKSLLKYLISLGLLEDQIELLQIEDLQGVTGLKAMRVTVNTDYVLKSNLDFSDQLSNDELEKLLSTKKVDDKSVKELAN